MENEDGNTYDTDLEDKESDPDDQHATSRLTFNEKLAAHRSNRLTDTFGQINAVCKQKTKNPKVVNRETLVPIRSKTSNYNERVQIYEKSCRALDIISDWQIRGLLADDTIAIYDRSFSFNDFRAFATAIGVNLESLTLHSVGLTSRSVHVLCQGLHKCPHLTLLNLSNNKIGKTGFESIVDTMSSLPSLLYLSLAKCGIQDSYGLRIGDLCRHENVIEVNLSENELEANACIFIGNALTTNTNLTYLNLSWNLIRSFASVALFRGMEVNLALKELDLSWSGLSYDGSVALRRVLIVNKTLEQLNISNCNIEWTSAKLISEGIAKNSTLQMLSLAYNPITTHGVEYLIQAINGEKSAVSLLDVSGITVFSTTVRLAEKIARGRGFVLRYDCEVSVHDILGRRKVEKADSMRKIVQHIDDRNWRTLEYFRLLDRDNKSRLKKRTVVHDIMKSGVELENEDIANLRQRFTNPTLPALTYRTLHTMINEQRMRDRALKIRQEQEEKDIKNRNQKILQTVSQHFPDIVIMTRAQKHKEMIEKLAKPRANSAHSRT